jgi:hypothetical protein
MSFDLRNGSRKLDEIWPILTPLALKIEHFIQNWSSRAEKLATSLYCMGNPKKIGP